MKQTVEEAAKEARMASAETLTTYGTHTSLDDFTYLSHDEIAEAAFIKGADWQAKQSPWISVEERLPEKDGYYLVTDGNIIAIVYFFKCWDKFARYRSYPFTFYENNAIKAYMPIPSFDEILEANKDVLQRIKEKGD